MKFQNCILINFVTDARTNGRTRRKQYAPSTFQSWGHKNYQHYIDARYEVLPTAHRNDNRCSTDFRLYDGSDLKTYLLMRW